MLTVLGANRSFVFASFALVSITAPTIGVISGGYLLNYLGGYEKSESFWVCRKIAVFAMLVALPIPLVERVEIFLVLVWLLLFLGACIVPGLTGMMLGTLKNSQKETGNSFTVFCYNMFGYLPSPILYGIICHYTGGEKSIWGIVLLMSMSMVGVGFLFLVDIETVSSPDKPLLEDYTEVAVSSSRAMTSGYLSKLYGVNINYQ